MPDQITTRERQPRVAWGCVVTEVRRGREYLGGVHHMIDGTFEAYDRGTLRRRCTSLDVAVAALVAAR